MSQLREGVLLASSGRAGMLLNLLRGTGQAPWQNHRTLNVFSVEVEKLCSGKMGLCFYSLLRHGGVEGIWVRTSSHSFLGHRQVCVNRL